jgi:chromosomal replication initiation ATPase DnaA
MTSLTRQRDHMRDIMRQVAARHGLTEADLLIHDRNAHYVRARREAWQIMRSAGYTYAEIGAISGRDHTTILHSVQSETSPKN